jgi:hypothetical protein
VARDLNDLRKQRGMALSDRISLVVEAGPRLAEAVEAHRAWISAQVLAVELRLGTAGDNAVVLDIEGEQLRVDLRIVGPPAAEHTEPAAPPDPASADAAPVPDA